MSSLFDLTNQYKLVQEALESNIDDEALKEVFSSIQDDIHDKADSYAYIINDYKGKIKAIQEEKKRLTDRVSIFENAIERLEENLKHSMEETGETKFSTNLHSFSIGSVGGKQALKLVVPVNELPEELKIYPPPTANNELLRKMIEEDGDLTYAELLPRKVKVKIR